jgi:hypothetical protein
VTIFERIPELQLPKLNIRSIARFHAPRAGHHKEETVNRRIEGGEENAYRMPRADCRAISVGNRQAG